MHGFVDVKRRIRRVSSDKAFLLFVWLIGFVGGIVLAVQAGSFFSWMRTCYLSRVSIVGLLTVSFFPFSITVVAVLISLPWLLYATAWLKMFRVGFSLGLVCCVWGTAGWLVYLLLAFVQVFTTPVLCWFQLRHCHGHLRSFLRDTVCCALWYVAVCTVDWLWIVPFLDEIF